MTKRLSFLLLDANVIIELFKTGLWDKVVEECDLHLARSVMGEAHFYEDSKGVRHDFDLSVYEQAGTVTVFEVPLGETRVFREKFDPSYFDRLDPGEAESLAYLVKAEETFRIAGRSS